MKDDIFEKFRLSIEMENGRLVTKYETDQDIPVVLKKVKGLILCSFYITGAVSNMDGFVKSEMIAMLEDAIRGVKNGQDHAEEVYD